MEEPQQTQACASDIAQQARSVLETYCYRCHGQSEPVNAGLNVLDVSGMVARGTIVRGDPDGSLLYSRPANQTMPPAGGALRPGEADLSVLKSWIACNAPDFNEIEGRTFVSIESVLDEMRGDLDKIDQSQRKFVRYFVLTHLYNAGIEDAKLELYRSALSKMVNSLSGVKKITRPVAIDAERKTIYRIQLTDYRWEASADDTTQDLWDLIVASYPYGGAFVGNTGTASLVIDTETPVPWIHADWFVNAASEPPLYYSMLQVPPTVGALESDKLDNFDTTAEIAKGSSGVARAGFNDSGVSSNHRVIDRFSTSFGSYWKSYDCKTSVGFCDIFKRPLGPAIGAPKEFEFKPDGGEIIFNLPNGLQGYMIVDDSGNRIDEAPTSIVFDATQEDGAVRPGRSCMGCHIGGIIPKSDMVGKYVSENKGDFSPDVVTIVEDIYLPPDDFKTLQAVDSDAYVEAIEATGAAAIAPEPVSELSADHDRALSLRRAAAELWMTEDDINEEILINSIVKGELGSLASGQAMKREVFEAAFPEIVCALTSTTEETVLCCNNEKDGEEIEVDCGGGCAPCVASAP